MIKALEIEIQLKRDFYKKKDSTEIPIYKGAIYSKKNILDNVIGFVKEGYPDKKGQPTQYFYLNDETDKDVTYGLFKIRKYQGETNNKKWTFYKCGCPEVSIKGLKFPATTDRMFDSVELQFITIGIDNWGLNNFTDKEYVLEAGNLAEEQPEPETEVPF